MNTKSLAQNSNPLDMFEPDPPPEPILRPQDSPDWNGVGGVHETEIESKLGLGDRVERIAQPIAKVVDKILGTNIQNCTGCRKRKQWLNGKSEN